MLSGCPPVCLPVAVYEALQRGSAECAVALTAHPSGRAQGYVHLHLGFRPLPPDQAEAVARADMEGGSRGGAGSQLSQIRMA